MCFKFEVSLGTFVFIRTNGYSRKAYNSHFNSPIWTGEKDLSPIENIISAI